MKKNKYAQLWNQSPKVWAQEMLFLLKMKLRLKMAIKMAEYKHYISSKKYYVLPDDSGGLMVVGRDQIPMQKKRGRIKSGYGAFELSNLAFYITAAYRGGEGAPTFWERKKMEVNYRKFCRRIAILKPQIGTSVPVKARKPKK